jgi:hypothetical protein
VLIGRDYKFENRSRPYSEADEEGGEEEEDLFIFNDTIEGPKAPAVKPGRITQA